MSLYRIECWAEFFPGSSYSMTPEGKIRTVNALTDPFCLRQTIFGVRLDDPFNDLRIIVAATTQHIFIGHSPKLGEYQRLTEPRTCFDLPHDYSLYHQCFYATYTPMPNRPANSHEVNWVVVARRDIRDY